MDGCCKFHSVGGPQNVVVVVSDGIGLDFIQPGTNWCGRAEIKRRTFDIRKFTGGNRLGIDRRVLFAFKFKQVILDFSTACTA